jgi:hypothetical protein
VCAWFLLWVCLGSSCCGCVYCQSLGFFCSCLAISCYACACVTTTATSGSKTCPQCSHHTLTSLLLLLGLGFQGHFTTMLQLYTPAPGAKKKKETKEDVASYLTRERCLFLFAGGEGGLILQGEFCQQWILVARR